MDDNLTNQEFPNVPQINLQFDDTGSFPKNWPITSSKLSLLEMNNTNTNTCSDLYASNKFEFKPRSSSVISEQMFGQNVDIVTRDRAGSLFFPNLCVHCKMLEDTEYQRKNTELLVNNLSDDEQLSINSFENTASGSSRSDSLSDSSPRSSIENVENKYGLTKEFGQFLEVPHWKPRASSLDSGIFHNELVISQSRRASFEEVLNQEKPRATSVDVHMQCDSAKTPEEDMYTDTKGIKSKTRFSIISISSRQTISRVIRKLKSSKFHLSPSKSKCKKMNYCSQWNYDCHSKEHIWYPDNSVRQRCTIVDCTQYNTSETYKCSSCKIVSCTSCKYKITDTCRKTFYRQNQDEEVSEKMQQLSHHWVHKANHRGTCKSCAKNMACPSLFHNKQTVVALQCSWCKMCYHNKKACFAKGLLTEPCLFGINKDSIVHPMLIEKSANPSYLSEKEFASSDSDIEDYPFVSFSIKRSDDKCLSHSKSSKPILAMINPKSGGRQGLDVLNELQWALNPRQVFDISSFSPEHVFKLYKDVTNFRILVGGGDGTVNWILRSVESCFCNENLPPIAVIPLGTGNDLSRELNWGSSYAGNDPISKIITDMENGTIVPIDIWRISAYSVCWEKLPTEAASRTQCASKLPLDSFNNYFSVGSDAATALEFHLDRGNSSLSI